MGMYNLEPRCPSAAYVKLIVCNPGQHSVEGGILRQLVVRLPVNDQFTTVGLIAHEEIKSSPSAA